jgi:hypothetical protein
LTLVQHKSIHFSTAISYCRKSMQPIERENRQNGNQESSQETSREESRKEGSEEEVTADPTKKATLKGGASSVPLGVLGQNSRMDTGENA